MKLRGIEFGNVFCASGARNFDGNGWPFHRALRTLGLLDFTGSTLVTKTTTLEAREGNMPLNSDGLTPLEFKPRCIVVKPFKGAVLNSVGLSGPGARFLLAQGFWQKRTEPFFISFMSVEGTAVKRLLELQALVELLRTALREFQAPIALELNVSCPNTGHELGQLVEEIWAMLDIVEPLGVPIVIKLNAVTPVEALGKFERHPALDGITRSNTIPWSKLPNQIDWRRLFGTDISPLAHLGGGGLSGKPLLPIVFRWIRDARAAGFTKTIVGCGGILDIAGADALLDAGANAIEIGSCAILRPWRVQGIIQHVNRRFNRGGA